MLPSMNTRSVFSTIRAVATRSEPLAGTVAFHNAYILLHTRQPPSEYPSKVSSRLQRALQLSAVRWRGIVNFSWSPEQPVLNPASNPERAEWDAGGEEAYYATAFSRYRGRLEIPLISASNQDAVLEQLEEHASPSAQHENGLNVASKDGDPLHLFVCTHGARDCRCGDTGGAVFAALRAEVERRQLSKTVKVAAVGHVGGHKYAANMLVFPYGEWLGDLKPENVPEVLDTILSMRGAPYDVETSPPSLPHFWRGRMGLDKAEQLRVLSTA